MNKRIFLLLLIIFTFLCLCTSCIFLYLRISTIPFVYPTKTFDQKELYGNWEAKYDGNDQDILVINKDGSFEQQYMEKANYKFLSGKNVWWLEFFPDGKIQLHLSGANYYYAGVSYFEYNHMDMILYDPFSKSLVDAKNELILEVVYKKSGQLVLHQMLQGPDEGFPIFDTGGQYFQKIK